MSVTVDDCVEYLGDESVWTESEVEDALAAETSLQAKLCRVPEDGDPALDQALLRRVMVSLAMRPIPLGYKESLSPDGPISNIRVGGGDREIDRLESPWRRVTIA